MKWPKRSRAPRLARTKSISSTTSSSYPPTPPSLSAPATLSLPAFLSQIDALESSLTDYTTTPSPSSTHAAGLTAALKSLELDTACTPTTGDGIAGIKTAHVRRLKAALAAALRGREQAELHARTRARGQLAHELRVVAPDATEADVEAVLDAAGAGEGVQVFAQATVARGSGARAALEAVAARHGELRRVEESLKELAALFVALEREVRVDEARMGMVEARSEDVAEVLEKVGGELDEAARLARKRRRRKWWVLGGVLLVVIVGVVIIVCLVAL